MLGLAGVALATIALFVNYDGVSSLWARAAGGRQRGVLLRPRRVVVATLIGLGHARLAAALRGWAAPRRGGAAASLHFAGLSSPPGGRSASRATVKAAGFIGLIGGLLVLAAGAIAARR